MFSCLKFKLVDSLLVNQSISLSFSQFTLNNTDVNTVWIYMRPLQKRPNKPQHRQTHTNLVFLDQLNLVSL